jgi:nucleotide-binding universal stress UspA family protein
VAEAVLRAARCPVLTAKVPVGSTPAASGTRGSKRAATQPDGTILWPIRTILHPTDFSECSRDAFQLACSLARDYGARLIVLHVTTVPDLPYKGYSAPASPTSEEEYLATVRKAIDALRPGGPQLTVERRFEEGDPASKIRDVASEIGADLIIAGTHGRTGLRHLLMGSVAEQVVRKAGCPVLTLRTPAN